MRVHRSLPFLILGIAALLLVGPVAARSEDSNTQTIQVSDARSGTGPCGFQVARTIEGEIEVSPSIDQNGMLVLAIEQVTLRGELVNPANGKTVELKWIKEDGAVTLQADGGQGSIAMSLIGHLYRGYDMAPTGVDMQFPADGAPTIAFEPGSTDGEPWAFACSQLS